MPSASAHDVFGNLATNFGSGFKAYHQEACCSAMWAIRRAGSADARLRLRALKDPSSRAHTPREYLFFFNYALQ